MVEPTKMEVLYLSLAMITMTTMMVATFHDVGYADEDGGLNGHDDIEECEG